MFGIGPNTIWLDLHGLLMFLILIFAAFLFGAIFFSKEADERWCAASRSVAPSPLFS